MEAIGGYLELELARREEYYPNHFKFNFARHAISFFFQRVEVKTIWVPSYICNSVIYSLTQNFFLLKFYSVHSLQYPTIPEIGNEEGLIIVNHFGLLEIENLSEDLLKKNNVLIDSSQSFFNSPGKVANIVYSPRKFFGIPDGAYLKTSRDLNGFKELSRFKIKDFVTHLLGRIEDGPEKSFRDYKKIQEIINNTKVQQMSNFSRRVLASIDYEKLRTQREENFLFLHRSLKNWNELKFERVKSPLCYPFLIKNGNKLRNFLVNNKIYVPHYWAEVLENSEADKYDKNLSMNLVCLPIDQRYNSEEMNLIVKKITEWKSN